MAIELEIASNKIKTNNKLKFKYESAKAVNETNYNYNCNRIELIKNGPKQKTKYIKKLYN